MRSPLAPPKPIKLPPRPVFEVTPADRALIRELGLPRAAARAFIADIVPLLNEVQREYEGLWMQREMQSASRARAFQRRSQVAERAIDAVWSKLEPNLMPDPDSRERHLHFRLAVVLKDLANFYEELGNVKARGRGRPGPDLWRQTLLQVLALHWVKNGWPRSAASDGPFCRAVLLLLRIGRGETTHAVPHRYLKAALTRAARFIEPDFPGMNRVIVPVKDGRRIVVFMPGTSTTSVDKN